MDGCRRQSGEVYQEARAEDMMDVTIVILVGNEERHIARC